jgi:thioredoxin reductase (NADPH)
MDTTEVENFPGYPESVKGPELIDDIKSQAEKFETRFITENVEKFELTSNPKILHLAGGKKIKTRSVILATGASARYLGLDSEKKLKGFGVSACAVCDGFFFKDQDVCVVGGGDSALEDAMYLTKFARKVHVIHRRDKLRASRIMQDRALKMDKIEFIWDSVVEKVLGDPKGDGVTGVKIKNVKNGKTSKLKVTGMFVALTNLPGVFAAGDVMDPVYQQAVTAAGSGCKAALDVEKFLMETK